MRPDINLDDDWQQCTRALLSPDTYLRYQSLGTHTSELTKRRRRACGLLTACGTSSGSIRQTLMLHKRLQVSRHLKALGLKRGQLPPEQLEQLRRLFEEHRGPACVLPARRGGHEQRVSACGPQDGELLSKRHGQLATVASLLRSTDNRRTTPIYMWESLCWQ